MSKPGAVWRLVRDLREYLAGGIPGPGELAANPKRAARARALLDRADRYLARVAAIEDAEARFLQGEAERWAERFGPEPETEDGMTVHLTTSKQETTRHHVQRVRIVVDGAVFDLALVPDPSGPAVLRVSTPTPEGARDLGGFSTSLGGKVAA